MGNGAELCRKQPHYPPRAVSGGWLGEGECVLPSPAWWLSIGHFSVPGCVFPSVSTHCLGIPHCCLLWSLSLSLVGCSITFQVLGLLSVLETFFSNSVFFVEGFVQPVTCFSFHAFDSESFEGNSFLEGK